MWKLYLIICICIFTLFNIDKLQKWINHKVKNKKSGGGMVDAVGRSPTLEK